LRHAIPFCSCSFHHSWLLSLCQRHEHLTYSIPRSRNHSIVSRIASWKSTFGS
jgi:hypothetical protein